MHMLLVNITIHMKTGLICKSYTLKNYRILLYKQRNGSQKSTLVFIVLTKGLLHLNFDGNNFIPFQTKLHVDSPQSSC